MKMRIYEVSNAVSLIRYDGSQIPLQSDEIIVILDDTEDSGDIASYYYDMDERLIELSDYTHELVETDEYLFRNIEI